jgi:aspartyl-tRNA(Asn)/glutamyl-tRNA(Gln) amidotransferase subunit B
MQWEVVIGLETHTQLQTKSKIFSGASTTYGAEPNTQACEVSIALPGVLPVLNKEAVKCAIKFGLAVNAEIAPRSVFARKNYFYPDHPGRRSGKDHPYHACPLGRRCRQVCAWG